ncbi:MAG TPA: PH domain-containing protein [Terriglobales bacterium]|nr:PH domain-containing protein [Terriglobales bacterium]
MPSIDQTFARAEHVCYRARLHWIVLVGPFVLAVVFGVPGVLLIVFSWAFWMDNFALQSALVSGIVMLQVAGWAVLLGLLNRVSDEIAVTNRRVVLNSGALIKRRAAQFSLQEIDSIEIQPSDLGRMLDYGSIVVHAAGKTAGPFRDVSQPFEFTRRVEEEIRKAAVSQKTAA